MDLTFDVDRLMENRTFVPMSTAACASGTRACTRTKHSANFLLFGSLEGTILLKNADAIRYNNGPYP